MGFVRFRCTHALACAAGNTRSSLLPLCLISVLILAGCAQRAPHQPTPTVVTRVLDGDTFEVDSRQKVRLLGVDAPETQHHLDTIRALGLASKRHLSSLLLGKEVRLERPRGNRDPYGRTLAYAYLTDGTFINRSMIEDGYALPYTKYPCSKTSELLDAAQVARTTRRGLWDTVAFGQEAPYEVRRSSSGICHAPGNKGFERMKRYEVYSSLTACVDDGGRLPRATRHLRSRLG